MESIRGAKNVLDVDDRYPLDIRIRIASRVNSVNAVDFAGFCNIIE